MGAGLSAGVLVGLAGSVHMTERVGVQEGNDVDDSRWVLLAESLESLGDAVTDLTSALVLGVPLLTIVLGALVWWAVGRTLHLVREAMERERRLVADVGHELRTPLAGARALLESESRVPAEIELNRLEALAVLARLETLADDRRDGFGGVGPLQAAVLGADLGDRARDPACSSSGGNATAATATPASAVGAR
jgi:signal transduction histidine kinase